MDYIIAINPESGMYEIFNEFEAEEKECLNESVYESYEDAAGYYISQYMINKSKPDCKFDISIIKQ